MASSKKVMTEPDRGDQILRGFDLLRKDGTCKDFTLTAQGKEFHVHKQILAVSSEYFQACFRSGMLEMQTDSMILPSVSANGLQQVLDFLYTGKMVLGKKTIYEVLETAVFLRVQDAVKLCRDYLLSQIKLKSVSEYLHVADGYHLEDLRESIDNFVLKNFHKFIKTDDFIRLSPLRLADYLRHNGLRCSEYKLCKALEKWVAQDLSKRAHYAESLLSYIKFASMSNEELNRLRKNSYFCENPTFHELVDEGMSFRCTPLQRQVTCFDSDRTHVRSVDHIISFASPETAMNGCILLNNKWHTLHNGMEQPKTFVNASVCTVKDFLFVCGGESNDASGPSSACYCLKLHNCMWTRMSSMKVGRKNFAIVSNGNNLYAIGGIIESNRLTDSVEKYDVTTDMWTYVCTMGNPLSDAACCCHRSIIYMAGGLDESCMNSMSFRTFLPRISMWMKRADLLNIKFRPKLFADGDKLYLADLYKTDGVPVSIDMYSINTNQWSILEATHFTFSRYFSALAIQEWIYFIGRNEVEEGHSKRFNMRTQEVEDTADFPWPVDSPLCAVVRIPYAILKSRLTTRS